LKKGYPILIVFCTIISRTTGQQMIVQYFTSPSVCFCTTWEKQNQRNTSWNEQKCAKKHPQHYQLWLLQRSTDFNNFGANIFDTTWH